MSTDRVSAGTDEPASASAPDTQPLQALFDSKFIPTEWQIRLDATHAKSKTHSL